MKKVILYLFLFFSLQGVAQEQFYNILNEDNGLLTNEVYDVHLSKEGFLFVAGDRGMQKYDGAKLERILPSWNKALSWAQNDGYGGVIFQSFNGQYWRYANDSIELIFDNSNEIIANKRFSISQNRYVVFTGVTNTYWYDVVSKSTDTIPVHSFKTRSGLLRHMNILSTTDKHAVGTIDDTLVFRVDRFGKKEFFKPEDIQDAQSLRDFIQFKGVDYFISRTTKLGVDQYFHIYRFTNGKFIKTYSLGPIKEKHSMNDIRLIEDQLFLLTHNGYWELDDHFQKKYPLAKLPKLPISHIEKDANGGLYISTLTKGVFYKPSLDILGVNELFNGQSVKFFDNTPNDLFYITEQGALYNYTTKQRISAIQPSVHNKFSKHKNDAIPLLVFGAHVKYQKFNTYTLHNKSWRGVAIDGIRKMSGWYKLGEIYIGGGTSFELLFLDAFTMKNFYTQYNCVWDIKIISPEKKIYNPLKRKICDYTPLIIRRKQAYDFLAIKQNQSFFVTYADSFYHYYPSKKVRAITGDKSFMRKYKSSNLEVRHLYQTRSGQVWAGGFRGLMKIEQDSVAKYYDEETGLPDNRIEFMKGFGDTILLGFSNSVSLFTEKKGVFQTYNKAMYFSNGSIKDAHIFKGELYVSTTSGVFKLPIQARQKNTPQAFIRYIQAGNKRWPAGKKIPFNKNNISIRVNGLNMNSGGTFSYYYRLHENEEWTKQSNVFDDIRFNSLTEGEYNFQLKVVNQWGETSKIQRLQFEIAPPFLRSWLFYLMVLLATLAIFVFVFWRRGKAIRRKAEFDKQLKQSEITAIKAQMNPHFIFNALNSIQNWIVTNDVKNSNIYLGKFSDLVRKTLEASEKNVLLLSKEIELIQLYLDLENLRFGKEIEMQFDLKVSENEREEIFIPTLLIQPYIENVFKHGLLHKKNGIKKLRILLEKRNGKLHCEIVDNGVGREKAQAYSNRNKKYKSFSTNANRKRIDLLNEMFDNQITLDIQDAFPEEVDCGTRVVLSLPIIDYDVSKVNR